MHSVHGSSPVVL